MECSAWLFGRGRLKIQAIGTVLGYDSRVKTLVGCQAFFRAIHDFFQTPRRCDHDVRFFGPIVLNVVPPANLRSAP